MPRRGQRTISVYVDPAEAAYLRLVSRRTRVPASRFILSAALAEAERVTDVTLDKVREVLAQIEAEKRAGEGG